MFYQLLQLYGVDMDAVDGDGVECQVRRYVCQQVGSETVDLEQLVGGDESAEALAVAHNTAGVGWSDAVQQLQGDGVGAVQFYYKWLASWGRGGIAVE